METRFLEYIEKIKTGEYKPAIKICWLYPDETVKSSFTEAMYDISGTINVTYQTGTRRTCNLTINNKNGQFPIDYENIWIGQKFQIWAGVYLDDGMPYYISQGIFCVTNPAEVYNPNTKTISIQGTDKWAFLDGKLFGYLTGMYKQDFGTNLKQSAIELLKSSKFDSSLKKADKIENQIDPKTVLFSPYFEIITRDVLQYYSETGDIIYKSQSEEYKDKLYILATPTASKEINVYEAKEVVESIDGEYYLTENILTYSSADIPYVKKENVFHNPYTIRLEKGKTLSNWYEEVGTILTANVYYDNFGYLRYEPMSSTINDAASKDKVLAWSFFSYDKNFLGITIDNDFISIYNDIIVLGKVVNGHQAKARLQNQDINSETNIYRIGVKTKPPYEDDMYYTDSLCLDLARYYAQTEMALNKKITVKSLPMYHLDVNQLIEITFPEKNIYNEKFLVTNFSLPLNGQTMSISCNNIRDFSQWTEVPLYD